MFTMSQIDLSYDCVSRPDWRWLKACKTHSRGNRYRKRPSDPEWLRPLLGLASIACGRKRRGPQIPVPPELLRAFEFYVQSISPRWELEARILAGQTDEDIAAAMDLPARS
jgi:hypothetical protein